MSEREMPLSVIQVDMVCDECGAGVIRGMSVTLTVNPPLYPHECPVCRVRKNYLVSYPCIRYVPTPPTEDLDQ